MRSATVVTTVIEAYPGSFEGQFHLFREKGSVFFQPVKFLFKFRDIGQDLHFPVMKFPARSAFIHRVAGFGQAYPELTEPAAGPVNRRIMP
ncbi:hypothetical protein FQZ97_1209890 [compost metagenome]